MFQSIQKMMKHQSRSSPSLWATTQKISLNWIWKIRLWKNPSQPHSRSEPILKSSAISTVNSIRCSSLSSSITLRTQKSRSNSNSIPPTREKISLSVRLLRSSTLSSVSVNSTRLDYHSSNSFSSQRESDPETIPSQVLRKHTLITFTSQSPSPREDTILESCHNNGVKFTKISGKQLNPFSLKLD